MYFADCSVKLLRGDAVIDQRGFWEFNNSLTALLYPERIPAGQGGWAGGHRGRNSRGGGVEAGVHKSGAGRLATASR